MRYYFGEGVARSRGFVDLQEMWVREPPACRVCRTVRSSRKTLGSGDIWHVSIGRSVILDGGHTSALPIVLPLLNFKRCLSVWFLSSAARVLPCLVPLPIIHYACNLIVQRHARGILQCRWKGFSLSLFLSPDPHFRPPLRHFLYPSFFWTVFEVFANMPVPKF